MSFFGISFFFYTYLTLFCYKFPHFVHLRVNFSDSFHPFTNNSKISINFHFLYKIFCTLNMGIVILESTISAILLSYNTICFYPISFRYFYYNSAWTSYLVLRLVIIFKFLCPSEIWSISVLVYLLSDYRSSLLMLNNCMARMTSLKALASWCSDSKKKYKS